MNTKKVKKTQFKIKQRASRITRWIVLGFFLVFTTLITIFHQFPDVIGRTLPIDSFCPMGGLEGLFSWIFQGKILQRLAISNFILILAVILIAVIYKRAFCGQICPLGTLQEIFGSFGRKILKKRVTVSTKVDKVFRLFKYVVLVGFIVGTWATGVLIIRAFDPWVAYAHLLSEDLFHEFTIGFIVLAGSLFLSVWIDRFFCKYLCPFGAFLAMLFPIGIYGINRNKSSCISCNKCNLACPMNVDVANSDRVIDKECISCNECVNVCPVEDTLVVETKGGSPATAMRVTVFSTVLILLLVTMFSFSGQFKWFFPNFKSTNSNIEFSTEEIRGFMSLREISNGYNVPLEILMEKFAENETDADLPINELSEDHKTDEVKEFVNDYKEHNH